MNERQQGLPRRRVLAGLGAGLAIPLFGVSSSAAQMQTEGGGEQLVFGEAFVSPDEIAVTVNGVEVTDSYERESGGRTYTEEAPEGMQFAWVDLTVENQSNQSEYLPFRSEISVRVGNQQYDAEYAVGVQELYESGQVGPGIVREGLLHYVIPADLSVSDLNVVWYGDNFRNQWTVTWSAPSSSGTTSPGGSPSLSVSVPQDD